MLTAWQKLSVYDTTRPFGPWLRGIAARLVLAHSRKQQKDLLTCTEPVLAFLDHQIQHIDQRPGDTWDEKIATLRQCIDALPPRHRLAIEQRYLESESAKNTAVHLEISLEALKKRLQRARVQLFECLNRKGVLAEVTP
jgi:RNA polymerase sigma-70 factor (ECF subfamily)